MWLFKEKGIPIHFVNQIHFIDNSWENWLYELASLDQKSEQYPLIKDLAHTP